MKEFRLRYAITEKDFMEAYEAHWKSNRQSTRSTVIPGIIGMVAGIAYTQKSPGWGIALAGLGFGLVLVAVLRRYLHVRAFRENPKFGAEIETVFSEENVEVKSAVGESSLEWSIFENVRETPRFVLLYLSPRSFSIIPKSVLGGRLDEFLELTKRKTEN